MTTAPAPVDHTWATVVATTNTSAAVPGIPDAVNVDTDAGSRAVGEVMSPAKSHGQGNPVLVPIEGWQPTCDALPGHKTVTFTQICSTPHPEVGRRNPDLYETQPFGAGPSDDVPAATKE